MTNDKWREPLPPPPVAMTITFEVKPCYGWHDRDGNQLEHDKHVWDWDADGIAKFCRGDAQDV